MTNIQDKCYFALTEESDQIKKKFDSSYRNELEQASCQISMLWQAILDEENETDEREAYVRTLFLTGSNYLFSSCQLIRHGLYAPSVAMLRPTWESFLTALLCSLKEFDVFERYLKDRYNTNDSLKDAKKYRQKIGLNETFLGQLDKVHKQILHRNIHPARLSLASDYMMTGDPNFSFGGHFDPAKDTHYRGHINEIQKMANIGCQLLTTSIQHVLEGRKS